MEWQVPGFSVRSFRGRMPHWEELALGDDSAGRQKPGRWHVGGATDLRADTEFSFCRRWKSRRAMPLDVKIQRLFRRRREVTVLTAPDSGASVAIAGEPDRWPGDTDKVSRNMKV